MGKNKSINRKENVSTNYSKVSDSNVKRKGKFSREYKLGLYLAIGSIGAAYVWPILGFLLSIIGFVNSRRAVTTYKENKIPLILNIVAFIFGVALLFLTKTNIMNI